MSIMPYKKCPNCNLYHDFIVEVCNGCGQSIMDIPLTLIDIESIDEKNIGKIELDNPPQVFVQKCPRCGILNFTTSPEKKVKVCYNCNKISISSVEPVIFQSPQDEHLSQNENHDNASNLEKNIFENKGQSISIQYEENENESESESDIFWAEKLRRDIGQFVNKAIMNSSSIDIGPTYGSINEDYTNEEDDDYDDDDDDDTDWGLSLKNTYPNSMISTQNQRRKITLTEKKLKLFSFTIDAGDDIPYMLGREANQSAFLKNDLRVGRKHCYLYYKNGFWYVKDNSQNGTAVNSVDIGQNGEHILKNGDELKLGHESDSIVFCITIKTNGG